MFLCCTEWQSFCDRHSPLSHVLLVKKTLTHVLFNSSHRQMRSLKHMKNTWSRRKWRYAWVLRPIYGAPCPQDRSQKAIDIYWWHLHTWIHLGASHCMNNSWCMLMCVCLCSCFKVSPPVYLLSLVLGNTCRILFFLFLICGWLNFFLSQTHNGKKWAGWRRDRSHFRRGHQMVDRCLGPDPDAMPCGPGLTINKFRGDFKIWWNASVVTSVAFTALTAFVEWHWKCTDQLHSS